MMNGQRAGDCLRAVQPGTFLELGALAGAVSSARLHARLVLLERGLAALLMAAPVASGDLAARFMSLAPAWAETSQLSRVRRRETAHAVRSCRR
jgi:hypothetical protein